jgi:hypothetical protein
MSNKLELHDTQNRFSSSSQMYVIYAYNNGINTSADLSVPSTNGFIKHPPFIFSITASFPFQIPVIK